MKLKRSYTCEVQQKLEELRGQMDVMAYVDPKTNNYPLYYVNAGDANAKRVLLSAGIHGDEPAGVYALLEFLAGPVKDYIKDINFSIFPCLNPWGFENDCRFNANGIDINRCFVRNTSRTAVMLKGFIKSRSGYRLAINMHEDNTGMKVGDFPVEANPRGFYLYETPINGQHLGPLLTRILGENGVEICKDSEIYSEKNNGGVIVPISIDGEFEKFLQDHSKKVIETETPTCWPLEKRIEAQRQALHVVLGLIK